jgi:hypothetical protein
MNLSAPSDYEEKSGSINLTSSDSEECISIPIVDHDIDEADEECFLFNLFDLSGSDNVTISSTNTTIFIKDIIIRHQIVSFTWKWVNKPHRFLCVSRLKHRFGFREYFGLSMPLQRVKEDRRSTHTCIELIHGQILQSYQIYFSTVPTSAKGMVYQREKAPSFSHRLSISHEPRLKDFYQPLQCMHDLYSFIIYAENSGS